MFKLKFRGRVDFPKPYRGTWRIESPPGEKTFEQSFDNVTKLDTTVEVVGYSVYMLVNGGIRSGIGVVGVGETVSKTSQKVYVIPTQGLYIEFKNNPRESSIVSVASGSQISYWNKIRTVVSVSVG